MADDGTRIVGRAEAHADEATRKRLATLKADEGVELSVDGVIGVWTPASARSGHGRVYPPSGKTELERSAALARLIEAARSSTARSDGPYGPRDELYDR